MRDLLLIAWHEFRTNVTDRRFLFFSLLMPLLIVVSGAIPVLIELSRGQPTVAYLDEGGWMQLDRLSQAEQKRLEVRLVALTEEASGVEGVRNGQYRSFWRVPASYQTDGNVQVTVRGDLASRDTRAMASLLRANLLGDQGSETVERLNDPMNLSYRVLGEQRRVRQGPELLFALAVPFFMALAFPLVISFSAGIIAAAIATEKENRMIEMLVTSTRPFSLVAGKVLGLGGLSLLQVLLWGVGLAIAALFLLLRGELPNGLPIPWDVVALSIPFFLLAFLFVATLMAGVGIVTGESRSAQQVSGLLMILCVIPLWLLVPILDEPNGLIARSLTLFPFTTAVLVPLRLVLGALEMPELLLTLLVLIMILAATIWAVARLFRSMMLRFGGTPSLRELLGRSS